MTIYIGVPRLPSIYQEVEYIQSSWTQYINTWYTPTVNTEIETELSWWSSQTAWGAFFWVTSNDQWNDWVLGRIYNTSVTIFNPWFCNSAYDQCQITTTTDTFHKVILKKDYCTLDWTAWTLTTTWTPYQNNIYLFCGNNWWSAWRHTSVKFRSFKISESWVLVRDFVPCYRKSDSVIWLYDLVNDTFYTNSWTGTFSKGNDVVRNELKNVYIGGVWTPWSNTVAYFPLTSDLVDVVTWNWPTATSGTITFTTKDWVPCAFCGSWNIQVSYNNRNWSTWNNPLTWHMWCNKNSYSHEWQVMASTWYWSWTRAISYWFHYNKFWTWWWDNDADHCDALIWQWALYSWTYDWTTVKAYLNWQLVNTVSRTYNWDANNYASLFSQVIQTETALDDSVDWYVREVIMEDIVWTAEEILDYYNYTKWDYWL